MTQRKNMDTFPDSRHVEATHFHLHNNHLKPAEAGHPRRRSSFFRRQSVQMTNFVRRLSRQTSINSGIRRLSTFFSRTSARIPTHFDHETETRIVDLIRENVLEKVAMDPRCATQADIEWIKNEDEMIVRYLLDFVEGHSSSNDPLSEEVIAEKVTCAIMKTLTYRMEQGYDQLKQTDFPKEFYSCDLIGEYVGHDDRLYIFLRGNKFKKAGEWTRVLLNFCAFELDKKIRRFSCHYRGIVDMRAIVILDARGVGIGQIDLGFIISIKSLLLDHFPRVGQELWIFGLPWIGRSVFNLVLKTLPSHYQDRIKIINLEGAIAEVGVQNIPLFMGGHHEDPKIDIPDGGCSLEECGRMNSVSPSEIKRMTDHLKSIIKS